MLEKLYLLNIKQKQLQIGSIQEEIEKVQQFFADEQNRYANHNKNAEEKHNNFDIEEQSITVRQEQRRASIIQRMTAMQEIREETDDEVGQQNENCGQSQQEYNNQNIGNCDICHAEIKLKEYQPLKCLHNFHRNCLSQKIIGQFEDEKQQVIRCCVGNCNKEISVQEVEETLPSVKFQQYIDFKVEASIENCIVYCPSKNCNMRFYREEGELQFCCTGCNQTYCLNCKTKWHPNITCSQFLQRKSNLSNADTKYTDFFNLKCIQKLYSFNKIVGEDIIQAVCPKCQIHQSVTSSDSIVNCSRCDYTFWCSQYDEHQKQIDEDEDQQVNLLSDYDDFFQEQQNILDLHTTQNFNQLKNSQIMKSQIKSKYQN